MWRQPASDELSAGVIDYALTAIAFGFGGYYGFISVYQAIDSSYAYLRLLPMSVALFTFAVWDVLTYLRPTQRWNVSYFSHRLRMYMAWWMLLVGLLIRQSSDYISERQNIAGEYGTKVLVFLVLGALCLYWRRGLEPTPRR